MLPIVPLPPVPTPTTTEEQTFLHELDKKLWTAADRLRANLDAAVAAMNMAIRGIDFNFGKEPANSFTSDQHPDQRADYVMANPPFNISEGAADVALAAGAAACAIGWFRSQFPC